MAEYKKPNVTAEGTYYFGGPVADADVHWSVLSSDYWFRYQCPQGQTCPWYSWTDFEWGDGREGQYYGSYGRLIGEGDAVTDDQVGESVYVCYLNQYTIEQWIEDAEYARENDPEHKGYYSHESCSCQVPGT